MLSVIAPAGLFITRELSAPQPWTTELSSDRVAYAYVLILTAMILAAVGYMVGRQADQFAALSETDALTGLPNRRAFERHLDEEYRRSLRYGGPLSLLLLDVDGLKQINDAAGHEAGDVVIRRIADTIVSELRRSDFAARWGGDEFAIVAPNTDAEAARVSAERIVARARSIETIVGFATLSIGVATSNPKSSDVFDEIDAFMRAADAALYRAKHEGRNRVRAA